MKELRKGPATIAALAPFSSQRAEEARANAPRFNTRRPAVAPTYTPAG